jgi:acyl carrier protein
MSELILEVKEKVIEALNLDVTPDDIIDDAPLFVEGLGLDSIDALELILILEEYGIKTEDQELLSQAFASIEAMAKFIEEYRK